MSDKVAVLEKSRMVLGRMGGIFFVAYGYVDEDSLSPIQVLSIPREKYEDMGEPEYITITIEPGDRLNP